MSGVTYDYQRIYEELKQKIEELQDYVDEINLDKLLISMEKLEDKYKIDYDDNDLPF